MEIRPCGNTTWHLSRRQSKNNDDDDGDDYNDDDDNLEKGKF